MRRNARSDNRWTCFEKIMARTRAARSRYNFSMDERHDIERSGRRFTTLLEKSAAQPGATALGGDILYGAEAIAEFMFGDGKKRRRVYNLADGGLPVFRIGANICARKSVLLAWIEAQESQGARST